MVRVMTVLEMTENVLKGRETEIKPKDLLVL